MSHKIKSIHAHEILDSRGDPTVQVSVLADGGIMGTASVPSGASTGSHEARELRDGDMKRYRGKGVLKACANVNRVIARKVIGMDVCKQRALDAVMLKLDGTKNKSKLGANAILGVSLAVAHAGAKTTDFPLYRYLRMAYGLRLTAYRLPIPMMNFMNGGKHADTDLDIQEFMIIPMGQKLFREQIRVGSEIFHVLRDVLRAQGLDTDLGNEGGYAPRLGSNERALKLCVEAIKKAGYRPGVDAALGMDIAANESYDKKKKDYVWSADKKRFTVPALSKLFETWFKKYPLISIEDPFYEDDWEAWSAFTKKLSAFSFQRSAFREPWIVGDDLFVTNKERLAKGIKLGAANAVLIKVNQIGTLSETMDTIALAQKNKYAVIISHRSGETCDTTIADLAVAVNADGIKTGSVARSERSAKYNRLMEIEEELLM